MVAVFAVGAIALALSIYLKDPALSFEIIVLTIQGIKGFMAAFWRGDRPIAIESSCKDAQLKTSLAPDSREVLHRLAFVWLAFRGKRCKRQDCEKLFSPDTPSDTMDLYLGEKGVLWRHLILPPGSQKELQGGGPTGVQAIELLVSKQRKIPSRSDDNKPRSNKQDDSSSEEEAQEEANEQDAEIEDQEGHHESNEDESEEIEEEN